MTSSVTQWTEAPAGTWARGDYRVTAIGNVWCVTLKNKPIAWGATLDMAKAIVDALSLANLTP